MIDELIEMAEDLERLADELEDETVSVVHTPSDPGAILRDVARRLRLREESDR